MSAVVNARDVLLEATVPRFVTPVLNGTLDFLNVTGTTKPSNNADVTATIVNGTLVITGGGITFSAGGALKGGQTGFNTGVGWYIGYSGGKYVLSIGDPAGANLVWDGANLTLGGNSDLNIGGGAKISGNKTAVNYSGAAAAAVLNDSLASLRALIGVANSVAQAVVGFQQNVSGTGVHGENSGGGYGVYSAGKLGTSSSALVVNLNADYLDGHNASDFALTGHTHSINDIGAGVSRSAQYSTDGGVTWNPITFEFL
jgi:hypothetical protein